ncbi:4-coumarate--coa ligase [Plakobranchus ocellatus]|uniref:4-coumarate--coa ligase n=1 Tax=Plakobranchus ocellatus TaxID=259542 RepID=A0AAV4BT78_9GAST|nr:4-coumarate--coa ligase [Plakobranchus ocellatus]
MKLSLGVLCIVSPQQGDLRHSGPPSGPSAGGGARARDRNTPADFRADSLATVPPTPPYEPVVLVFFKSIHFGRLHKTAGLVHNGEGTKGSSEAAPKDLEDLNLFYRHDYTGRRHPQQRPRAFDYQHTHTKQPARLRQTYEPSPNRNTGVSSRIQETAEVFLSKDLRCERHKIK